MVIASGLPGRICPATTSDGRYSARASRPRSAAQILEAIAHRGIDFVAQEAVTLSTTPVWRNGRLEPRPFTLRLFLARAGDGWRVMPGGFVRVADDADARAVSLQRGGRTGDAWVLSDKPVAETTLLPAPDRIAITRATGALPSRAAANLFWVAATWSAPRRRCGWCGRWSTASPTATRPRRGGRAASARCSAPGRRCRPTCRTPGRCWSPPPRCSGATSTARCRIWSAPRNRPPR